MDIIEKLQGLLGESACLSTPDDTAPFLEDERGLYEGRAACVVLPTSTDEVAAVVRLCAEQSYSVVPQGGNTGYCGGASPDGDQQVLLNLSRMNRILNIDPAGFTATVEAGVVLASLHEAVEKEGLFFPLSMGSEGSAQVGGVLSTNAGGLAVLRYGTAGELALGLEVVLPSGEVMNLLTALRKDNTGYDLKRLFIGAEGTLGIITRAVLKLFPQPTARETAWLSLPDADSVTRLLSLARRVSGDTVTSFEYISASALEFARTHIDGLQIPFQEDFQHQVLLEVSAPLPGDALRAPMEALVAEAIETGLVLDGVLAESETQRAQLWRIRETIPEAEKHAGRSIKHDVSVPISLLPEYLEQAPKRLAGIAPHRPSIYGHVGDGNLHYNILAPEGEDPGNFRKHHAQAFSEAIHALAAEMQGSFSAEHGIGKLKKAELAQYKDPAAIATMRAVKQTLDPKGLMNPGKLF